MSNEAQAALTARPAVEHSEPSTGARPTSSAEYLVTEIQKHKKVFAAIAPVVLIAILVGAVMLRNGRVTGRSSQPLTEKDTILLADFVNTTGDKEFDGALKQAL